VSLGVRGEKRLNNIGLYLRNSSCLSAGR